ncbi:MAG: signal peptidase I [Patescibacteria group bacterium]
MEEQTKEAPEEIPRGSTAGRILAEVWEVVRMLLISAAIIVPIRYFIVQPFVVRGASMEPTFSDREYLVIDEASYYFRPPARGEMIVFHYPRDPRQFFIKRIIGLPGERVKIEKGQVMIANAAYPEGFTLQESYLNPPGRATHPDMETALGDGEYFVMGDNRDFSSDSRLWGILPQKRIVGRAVFRAWPFARFGSVADSAFGY